MANGTRTLTLLIVLVVGLAVGWFIGHPPTPTPQPQPPPVPTATPTPTCPAAGHHLIEVGPAASNVSEKDAVISWSKGHKVLWIPQDDQNTLEITFRVSDFPKEAGGEPPFKGGKNGKDQVIKCNPAGVCKPVRINDDLKDKLPECPKTFYYKYSQTLIHPDGTKEEADAGIIIER